MSERKQSKTKEVKTKLPHIHGMMLEKNKRNFLPSTPSR